MTISSWNRDRLRELGLDAALIPPGIDLDNFRPLPDVERRTDMLLAARTLQPAEEPAADARGLARAARATSRAVPVRDRAGAGHGARSPLRDRAVGRGGQRAVQPGDGVRADLVHEGFCLPALESMATGGAVVCTDAHGNRDFCVDGENCLMPGAGPGSGGSGDRPAAGRRPPLRERLGQAGIATAARLRMGAADRCAGALPDRDRRARRDRAVDRRRSQAPPHRRPPSVYARVPRDASRLRRQPSSAARSAGATGRCACAPTSPTSARSARACSSCSACGAELAGPPRRRRI